MTPTVAPDGDPAEIESDRVSGLPVLRIGRRVSGDEVADATDEE